MARPCRYAHRASASNCQEFVETRLGAGQVPYFLKEKKDVMPNYIRIGLWSSPSKMIEQSIKRGFKCLEDEKVMDESQDRLFKKSRKLASFLGKG